MRKRAAAGDGGKAPDGTVIYSISRPGNFIGVWVPWVAGKVGPGVPYAAVPAVAGRRRVLHGVDCVSECVVPKVVSDRPLEVRAKIGVVKELVPGEVAGVDVKNIEAGIGVIVHGVVRKGVSHAIEYGDAVLAVGRSSVGGEVGK